MSHGGGCKGAFWQISAGSAVGIVTSDEWYGIYSTSAPSLLDGPTAFDGRPIINLMSEADNGSGKLRVEHASLGARPLVNDDIVTLANMNNAAHSRVTKVTYVDATHFDCQNVNYVAGAGATSGVCKQPAYLRLPAGGEGTYEVTWSIIGAAGDVGLDYTIAAYRELVMPDILSMSICTATGYQTLYTKSGLVALSASDRIWLGVQNLTDNTDFSITSIVVSLVRV